MSECFCGCGETYGILQQKQRRANRLGAELTRLIGEMRLHVKPWVDAGRPGFEEVRSLPGPTPAEDCAQQIADGEALRANCLLFVHSLPGGEQFDRKAAKSWIETFGKVVVLPQMPIEHRRRFAAALMNGTAQEIYESFEAGRKAAAL